MRNDITNERNDELSNRNDDQLRPNTTNENIREAGAGDNQSDAQQKRSNADAAQGINYSPNDASGVLSGGTSDMDDQGDVGAHAAPGSKGKFGSNLEPKHNVTGSDFDGQVSTS